MSPFHRSVTTCALAALSCMAASGLHAQQIVFNNPVPGTVGFGTTAVIVSDADGLGRRDVIVGDAAPGSPNGTITLMSSETQTAIALFPIGIGFGTALANVGDILSGPNEEVVVSDPTNGLLWVFTTDGGFQVASTPLAVPVGSGASLATLGDLNGDGTPEVAVGDPGNNQVLVVDILSTNPAAPVLYSITDPRLGGFGAALAAGPPNRLAIGAPNWSNVVPAGPPIGYVNIHKLDATVGAFGTTFTGPLPSAQQFGNSIAAIGDLGTDGMSEFAVHAPAGGGFPALVYVVDENVPAPIAMFTYGTPGVGSGRIAALGDIDGDSRGDFAMTDGVNLRLFTTPAAGGLTLAAIALATPTTLFDGALASGPDVFGVGVVDVVAGRDTATGPGLAEIEPIAVVNNLPNPPAVAIAVPAARPMLGAVYPLTVGTTSTTPIFGFLMVDFAPALSTPFGNGIAYVRTTGGAVTVGLAPGLVAGAPVTFTGIMLPASPVFLYNGLVFQAGGVTGAGAFLVSNGILIRLGTL